MVENLTYTLNEHLEETLHPNSIKSNMNAIVWKQVCVLVVLLALCSDCVLCVYSLLDASVAEEDIEGEFYQEEEDYPGHFANQDKPSFESYSKCLVLLLHSTCFK
jgi:hypothetical protein